MNDKNSANNTNNPKAKTKKKKGVSRKVITILLIIIITVLYLVLWAGFTKLEYIPNFLGIDVLRTEKKKMQIRCQSQGKILHGGKCVDAETVPFFNEYNTGLKPVIYLYPTKKQDVEVKLDYKGEIFADYPKYNEELKGWRVLAYPSGKLINYTDGKEYSYLFWEGRPSEKIEWDLSTGFVVRGKDTKEFLQKTLSQIGLTPKEYNEFIVYWFPKMQDNVYNLIHFAHEKYTDSAPLTITPKPDSMLRVFMVFKPLEKPVEIKEQKLEHFERKGFSVVEWGGSEMK